MDFYDYREIIAQNLILFLRKKGYTKLSFSKLSSIPRVDVDLLLENKLDDIQLYNHYIQEILSNFNLKESDLLIINKEEIKTNDKPILYLVMIQEKPTESDIERITNLLNIQSVSNFYDGESTKQIKENLLNENNTSVLITADSRLLMFVHEIFLIDNVYIYQNNQLLQLQDATDKVLRPTHNLMKMYEVEAFTV